MNMKQDENKVNDYKALSYCGALRYKYICHAIIIRRSWKQIDTPEYIRPYKGNM